MLLGIPVNYCHKKFIIKKSRVDLHKRSCGPKVRLGWSTSSWEVQLIQEPVRYFALGAVRHVQKVTDRRVDGAGPLQSTLLSCLRQMQFGSSKDGSATNVAEAEDVDVIE